MPLPRQLLQIDYDQFQRYAAITALLQPLLRERAAATSAPLRILEVGSHSLHLLPAFLAPISVEIVRADLEPGLAGDLGPYVTLEPGCTFPFDDDAFDFTVALEVLEHIPPDERDFAISEWARVASQGVLFSCPSGKRVRQVEERADAAFQARHGRVHPWLEEHERYGRPTRREVQQYCRNSGLACHRFHNSPLSEWLPLLLITEQIFEQGDKQLLHRFNEMLNQRPTESFLKVPGYRSIYAAFHSPELKSEARKVWERAGLFRKRGLRRLTNDAPPSIDPVQLLAQQLGDHMIQHRQREVDTIELAQAQRQVQELEERLKQTELALAWERHQQSVGQPASQSDSLSWQAAQLNHLELISPQHWLVQGTSPYLEWEVYYQRGWHRLVLEGVIGEAYAAILQLDYGQGFNETHVIKMTGWPQGRNRTSFNTYLDHPVRRVRLCFTQKQGTILELDTFQLKPRPTWRVACDGLACLATQLRRQPRKTWQAAPSLLRYGMRLTTKPTSLPFACMTPYQRWLRQQRPSDSKRAALVVEHQQSTSRLAIFVRCDKETSAPQLARTLQSLHAQDACRWELWIALPAARHDLRQVLLLRQMADQVHWLDDGPDVGLATLLNRCASQSHADWLMQLSPGDQLEPDAALQLLETARQQPGSGMIYADEDELLPNIGEANPLLKPRLFPESVSHQPALVGHAVALHVPTLLRLGGMNPSYDGALLVEYVQRLLLAEQQCTQLQRVLLHRPPSPAVSPAVKQVWERLREDYAPQRYQIRSFRTNAGEIAPRSMPLPVHSTGLVSILIPSAGKITQVNGQPHLHLERCLQSLRQKTTYGKIEIIVVDDGSLSTTALAALKRYDATRVTVPGPFNFSCTINRAAAVAQGDYLLLLNDDTEVITSDWIERLMSLAHAEIGAVGAKLLFPTGLVQHVGISMNDGVPIHPYYNQPVSAGYAGCNTAPRNWLAVTAACLLTPRRAFEAVQGFDESFELNYNDVDFCLRLWQAGYRVVMNPTVELYHHEALRSDGRACYRPDELARFQTRWRDLYRNDPHFRVPPGERGLS